MASKIKLLNSQGSTATLENNDSNLNDYTIDIAKITKSVDTVEDLASLTDAVDTVIVKDKDRGGVFNAIASTTANNGTIFDGDGCSWERLYEGAVNVKWFGANNFIYSIDSAKINSSSMQNAIDYTSSIGGGIVKIPSGTYGMWERLIMKKNVSLVGEGSNTWSNGATTLTNYHDTVVIQIGLEENTRSMSIANISIVGHEFAVGVKAAYRAYSFELNNVTVRSCNIGFSFDTNWNIKASMCTALICDTGFYFTGSATSTSSHFDTCLAYSASRACWHFESVGTGISYSTFTACGGDGGAIGLLIEMPYFRGTTFQNFGFENITTAIVNVNHSDAIVNVDSIALSAHTGANIDDIVLFLITACRKVTISNLDLSTAHINNCKFIELGAAADEVHLDNVTLDISGATGTMSDIVSDRILITNSYLVLPSSVGYYRTFITESARNGLIYNNSRNKEPMVITATYSTQTQANIKLECLDYTVKTDGTGGRYLAGTPIFDTSNIPDGAKVKFTNVDTTGLTFAFRTEGHTAGTGIVQNATDLTTIYLRNFSDSATFVKHSDGKLYHTTDI